MEHLITIDNQTVYVFEDEYVPTSMYQSKTKVNESLMINGVEYVCKPIIDSYCPCVGCNFFSEITYKCNCVSYDLPCAKRNREDMNDVIFKEVRPQKAYCTSYFKKLATYRFK